MNSTQIKKEALMSGDEFDILKFVDEKTGTNSTVFLLSKEPTNSTLKKVSLFF